VALAVALAVVQTAAAVVYEGIDFTFGDGSFADDISSFQPSFSGGPVPTDPNYIDPDEALGPPNYVPDSGGMGGEFNGTGAVALGHGGRVRLDFIDNVAANTGSSAPDLAIFERGVDEAFLVAVRPANATTRALLGTQCPATGYCTLPNARLPLNDIVQIDLDAEFGGGFAAGALRFDSVQLTDTITQGASSGEQVGPDIDAVGGIASDFVICGDGLVEVSEQCDDGGVVDGDGCASDCRIETCWTCTTGVDPSVCTIDAGGSCDDGEECTEGDFCGGPMGTTCIGGPPPDCDDSNICTDDICVDGVGCTSVPNSAPCDDGSSCSADDQCAGGACVGTAVEFAGCRLALGTTKLYLINRFDDFYDKIVWVWPAGEATPESALGDPMSGTGEYELCVFDGPPTNRRLRAAGRAEKGAICENGPCWRLKGAFGFLYKNPEVPEGLRQLLLKTGTEGKARVVAKGRGEILGFDEDMTLTLPARVQLHDTSTNECWEDVYPEAIRNDAERFKAKH
jgi:cysteine-rich repeat protein